MSNDLKFLALLGAAAITVACAPVHAAPHGHIHRAAPGDVARPAPFTIELIDEHGRELETYRRGNRYYVLGEAGTRYAVRVTNRTARRVEAVVSVDGLDVIDGEDADVGKRGYVVLPYDELRVDGFRTSPTSVATFRFSSVSDSYAERKGKGRNIGVVGVAIFEERGDAPVMVAPPPIARGPHGGGRWDDRGDRGAAPSAAPAERSRRSSAAEASAGGVGAAAPRAEAEADLAPSRSARPGLGTEFGEARWSHVDFTRFVRRHARRPDALAELRYDDAGGLTALGIVVTPPYDHDELARREHAEPFPGARYAQPPR